MLRPSSSFRSMPFALSLVAFAVLPQAKSSVRAATGPEAAREEYRAALAEGERAGGQMYLLGRQKISMSEGENNLVKREEDVLVARSGDKLLLRLRSTDGGRSRKRVAEQINLFLGSDVYHAQSHRVGGPYYLVESAPLDQSKAGTAAGYNYSLLGVPYSFLGVPIGRLLSDPNFVIGRMEPEESEGGKRWRVPIMTKADTPEIGTGSGWFVVDPSLGWASVAYEYRTTKRGVRESPRPEANDSHPESYYRGKVTYQGTVEGHPIPERIEAHELTILDDGRNIESNRVLDLSEYKWEPYPEREFTLAHYDFDDRKREASAKAIGRGVGLSILSILLMGLSIYVKKRRDNPQEIKATA